MEQSNLNEILKALELHSSKITDEMDKRFAQMDERFTQMDDRFDRLETKFDSLRIELSDTQETVDFLSSKYVQHEKKLRKIYEQHT